MDYFESNIQKLNKKYKRRKLWMRVLSVLMSVTVFVTTYALILPAVTMDTSDPSVPKINWGSLAWDDVNNVITNPSITVDAVKNTEYYLQYSDDSGLHWDNVVVGTKTYSYKTPDKNFTQGPTVILGDENATCGVSNSDLAALINDPNVPLERRYRIHWGQNNNAGQTATYDFLDILEQIKPNFRVWLAGDFVSEFHGTKPTTKQGYLDAFDQFYHLPTAEVTISVQETYSDPVTATVELKDENGIVLNPANYTYQWQYYDQDLKIWTNIGNAIYQTYETNPTGEEIIPFGGANVRCLVRNISNNTFVTTSEEKFLNPQQKRFADTIGTIETALNLSSVPVNGGNSHNLTYNSPEWDYVYFTALAMDDGVPFSDKESYWNFLCKVYLKTYDKEIEEGETAQKAAQDAVAAVQKEWTYYRYDMIDPGAKNSSYGTYYASGTFGDSKLSWAKTNDRDSSFHYVPATGEQMILPIGYNYLENGVDYDNFIRNMKKYATADAAGDGNTERKYTINMTTDAHAQLRSPIVIIFQVQTSWQLFDLLHANAKRGDGDTEVGAMSFNTEMATFYDIKHAMLDLCDYMEKNYPGNTLVIGLTEVRHGDSDSMFNSTFTTENGSTAPLYVSNNPQVLYDAISQWDIFGNCEHVHYDNDTLKLAVQNLPIDLSDFKDKNGNKISYDQIRKTAIIIGGPTENNDDENGYGCVLPWSSFSAAGLDSVYGIRVNEGTSLVANTANGTPILSWLDIDENNNGHYTKTNNAQGFTEKYVCTSREALFEQFVSIVEQEFDVGGVDIYDTTANVENLKMSDTIRNEFKFDYDKPVTVEMTGDLSGERALDKISVDLKNCTFSGPYSGTLNKSVDGNTEVYTFDYDNNGPAINDTYPTQIVLTNNADGTTSVDIVFNKIYNTQKAEVSFGIQAKSDYIGSNNVYTNVNVPETTYFHGSKRYVEKGKDKPQVNVPIEFTTENGGHKVLFRSPAITYDIALNDASRIPAAVQNLVDNYGQINGTLTYEWILPEAGQNDPRYLAGTTQIKNGVVQGGFPDISKNYTFTQDGFSHAELVITFTPNQVSSSGNFHDEKTRTAVNEKDHSGIVTFQVLSADTTETLHVKKTWKGTPSQSSIDFKLVYQNNRGENCYYMEDGQVKTFTLYAVNEWEGEFEISPTPDGNGSVYEYTAIETEVPGYSSSVTFGVDRTYEYKASINAYFTPQYSNGSDAVKIYYMYNNVPRTIVLTGETLSKNTSWMNMLEDGLETKENGDPYTAIITRVEFLDGNEDIIHSVFKNDIDAYDSTITQVGYPMLKFKPSVKIGNKLTVKVRYKVSGQDSPVYEALYKPQSEIAANSEVTVTGSDVFPLGTEFVIESVEYYEANKPNNVTPVSITDVSGYLGMRKQHVSFTTPINLTKNKIVRIQLTKVGENPGEGFDYVGEYTVPDGGINAGSIVEYDFTDLLPDGEYYLTGLTYDENTSMLNKTTVTFISPIAIAKNDKNNIRVTLSDNSVATLNLKNLAIAAGDTVVVEFVNNPPSGTTVTDISYNINNGAYNPLTAETKIDVRTPIALANNTVVNVTIHDDTENRDITATRTLNQNVAENGNFTVTNFSETLNFRHSYTVTNVTYRVGAGGVEKTLETPGTVTFIVPYAVNNNGDQVEAKINQKIVTLTVKEGDTTIDTVTGTSEKKDYKSGQSITVKMDSTIPVAPEGHEYTYELTSGSDKGTLNISDFTFTKGGTKADAFLTVGGEMPQAALFIGGQLPDNTVTSKGFNTISAIMDIVENVTLDAGISHTVTYRNTDTGETGTFTATPEIIREEGVPIQAIFTNTSTVPQGNYEIVSITRLVNDNELSYYNDLIAYLKTGSMLNSINVTSVGEITNTPIVNMPSTGGRGPIIYVMTGLTLMISAIIYGFILRRKRERRPSD